MEVRILTTATVLLTTATRWEWAKLRVKSPLIPNPFTDRRCLLVLALLLATAPLRAKKHTALTPESYRYDIEYHWGILWKKAAEATLTLHETQAGERPIYRAELIACTAPFADRIFRVRDTLFVTMEPKSYRPLLYGKITNEDNVYRKDIHHYLYRNGETVNQATLYRPHRNAIDKVENSTTEVGLDMMSLFFYLRRVDFASLSMHERIYVKIFSGGKVEHLSLEYMGRTLYQRKGMSPKGAYKLGLRFSLHAGGKESDYIAVLVSDDANRYPLYMEGKLPIGALKVYYTGK